MPAKHGLPSWIHIPAVSVPRAKTFYTNLLHLQFHTEDAKDENGECIAFFGYPDHAALNELGLGGMIKKIDAGEKIVDNHYRKETGLIVTTLYFLVDDLDHALKEVGGWGGEVLCGKVKQGESGFYAVVKDTEGNPVGLYMCSKKE